MEFVNRHKILQWLAACCCPIDLCMIVKITLSFPCGHISFSLSLFIWKMGVISLDGYDNKGDKPC